MSLSWRLLENNLLTQNMIYKIYIFGIHRDEENFVAIRYITKFSRGKYEGGTQINYL